MPGLAASTSILSEYNFLKLILKYLLEWEIPLAKSLWTIMPRVKKSKMKTSLIGVSRYSGSGNGKTYQYQKSNHHLECKK
jgi:hypothetical protein